MNAMRPDIRQGKTTNLRQQFFLWSAIILLSGGLLLSGLSYWNTRRLLMAEAMGKSEVILREVEAIRSYVKEELRPKMYELHGRDTFIIEAMSTTFVSTTIMKRFTDAMPDYVYRRVSLNPHNPRHLADPFEEEMIDWFAEDSSRTFWQGTVRRNDESFFISMIPDTFSQACIRCHGRVEDAPPSLVERYGPVNGFRFQAGDLAGINSVAIPVSASLRAAWQGSLIIFGITLAATLVWVWLLNFIFQRLVVERLAMMLSQVGRKQQDSTPGDELDALQASLGSLRRYVRSARQGAKLEPNFIGDYTVNRPLAAGAMSWLYSGCCAKDNTRVGLKIGFEEAMRNPLYRGCYEMELHLFETLQHPCLPAVIERLDDVLVLKEIRGRSLIRLLKDGPLEQELIPVLFQQLCELTALLHANGIVHHDLRPHIMTMDDNQQLQLFDMGLAASDLQPDPIAAAGLTPQGDPLYMAPEQLRGKRGDARSDIYSLGVLLYFATTGTLPFMDKQRTMQGWIDHKERITSGWNEQEAAPLDQVIHRAMAHDPEKRYQWVEDFLEDLIHLRLLRGNK